MSVSGPRRVFAAAAACGALALGLACPASADTAAPVPALAHHTVGTHVPEAQERFDEGLTLLWAFNRDESARRFEAAAKADPSLAIAWWGVALANGPNINFPLTAERLKKAQTALATAKSLEGGASPEERRLIDALAVRYPATYANEDAARPGYVAYRDAMARVHADYPADSDVAVLYVESVFDVDDVSWSDGKPSTAAALVDGILEDVLQRDPLSVGANHFYVHANDFVGAAGKALPSAERLSALPAEPAASHLVHMSGHIYLDLGMFAELERDNRTAVDDDRAFAATLSVSPWDLDYFGHNLDFYLGGATMLDDRPQIDRALDIARTSTGRPVYVLALARRGDWAGVLAWPAGKGASTARGRYQITALTYARGLAFVATGDLASARAAEASLEASRGDSPFVGALADLLAARLAHATGNDDTALTLLRRVQAFAANYPPEVFSAWYFPTGEWIGAILLQRGDLAGAEAAYRADLVRTPHNARALYGLMQTLTRQGRLAEARALAPQIAANWRGPYSELRAE
jgi:hypothetical protein